MVMNSYQAGCRETAVYPQDTQVEGLNYTMMGLGGEVGELQNKFKKVLRGDHGHSLTTLPDDLKIAMKEELGDILWYIAEIATQLEFELSDVASANLFKLKMRKHNNTIKGEGDHR